jgi:hypothetical protein
MSTDRTDEPGTTGCVEQRTSRAEYVNEAKVDKVDVSREGGRCQFALKSAVYRKARCDERNATNAKIETLNNEI